MIKELPIPPFNSVNFCFIYFFILFIYLFLAALGLHCCAQAFSSCGKQGPLFAVVHGLHPWRWLFLHLHGGGFSYCRAQALGAWASIVVAHGLSSCGSQALERRLSSCGAWAQLLRGMWDLPGPGLEPVSPALAGRFLTTAPPGKSCLIYFEAVIRHIYIYNCQDILISFIMITRHFLLLVIPFVFLCLLLHGIHLYISWYTFFHPFPFNLCLYI